MHVGAWPCMPGKFQPPLTILSGCKVKKDMCRQAVLVYKAYTGSCAGAKAAATATCPCPTCHLMFLLHVGPCPCMHATFQLPLTVLRGPKLEKDMCRQGDIQPVQVPTLFHLVLGQEHLGEVQLGLQMSLWTCLDKVKWKPNFAFPPYFGPRTPQGGHIMSPGAPPDIFRHGQMEAQL